MPTWTAASQDNRHLARSHTHTHIPYTQIEDELLRQVQRHGHRQPTFTEAWNSFVHATGGHPLLHIRCHECNGRRWSHKSIRTPGPPICGTCHGNGRSTARPSLRRIISADATIRT